MAFLKEIQQAGLWLTQAQACVGSIESGITAAGTTQATAYQLSKVISNVTTAALNSGVVVPTGAAAGDQVLVRNGGANALAVYPVGTATINGAGAGVALSLAVGKTCQLVCLDGSNWIGTAGA